MTDLVSRERRGCCAVSSLGGFERTVQVIKVERAQSNVVAALEDFK